MMSYGISLSKSDCAVFSNNKLKSIFLSLIIICISGISVAWGSVRDSVKVKKNILLSGYTQFGSVMATNPFLKPSDPIFDHDYDFVALSFQLLKQTTGQKQWEKNFGYPVYGFGIYSATFSNTGKLGTPIAIYAVFKAPFKRWSRFSLNYEGGFGLTFNWEGYNPAESSYNISMGSNQSVYIDIGFNFKYALGSHFDVSAGYSFTHFSNGALKYPNYGLNTFAPKITIDYNINRFVPSAIKEKIKDFIPKTTLDLSLFGGAKNVQYTGNEVDSITKYKGVNYSVYGFNTLINHQITHKSKIGIGLTLGYDGSYNSTIIVKNGQLEPTEGFRGNRVTLSIFPSYELVINRLSVLLQPGFYLFRKAAVNNSPIFFQRLGLHYMITDHLLGGINIRAYNYHVSDYIEWTLGYRLSLMKKGAY